MGYNDPIRSPTDEREDINMKHFNALARCLALLLAALMLSGMLAVAVQTAGTGAAEEDTA